MDEKKDTRGEQLRRALGYERKNGYDRVPREELEEMEAYCSAYKEFLNAGKTERECVDRAVALAEATGFRQYQRGASLRPGDKIFRVNRDKALMLAVMGRKGLGHGVNICAAHIDSPRLDLKQNPLYESDELAFLKTHYYGGIRKYQWVTIPLELHGVIALKNGQVVRVSVGGGEGDPVFTVDSVSWQEGQRDNNPSALEESGIPTLRAYLLTKTAEAKETLTRAEQAELDTRRQTLFEALAAMLKVCKAAQDKAAQDTQTKLAAVNKAWSTFEAELKKAMPSDERHVIIWPYFDGDGRISYWREKATGLFCEGEAKNKVKEKLRNYYEKYYSSVRREGEKAIGEARMFLTDSIDSAYHSCCDKLNQVFSKGMLSLMAVCQGMSFTDCEEIKVSANIPSTLRSDLLHEFASSNSTINKSSFDYYADHITGYESSISRTNIFGGTSYVKCYEADSYAAASLITEDINSDLKDDCKYANDLFNREVWRPFCSKLSEQVHARKAALKQQLDDYRKQLQQGSKDTEKTAAALSHLDTLAKEARA